MPLVGQRGEDFAFVVAERAADVEEAAHFFLIEKGAGIEQHIDDRFTGGVAFRADPVHPMVQQCRAVGVRHVDVRAMRDHC